MHNVIGAGGQAGDMQRQTPGCGMCHRALVGQPTLDQRVGHALLQVVGRLRLHAGRDFFGEEFEEKIGHGFAALGDAVS